MFFFKKKPPPKVLVVGLDGVPHSFITREIGKGCLPNLARIFKTGSLRRMNTVIPPISSVAWTSFATGVNPARHRIFGFMDRRTAPMEIFIPTASRRAAPTLWRTLSENGKKVGVINVPVTYPPEPVNGFLVSGFLATDIMKATHPPELAHELKKMDYLIDVDTWKVREDRSAFLDDVFESLKIRLRVTIHLMKTRPWDFFISHVMETDRVSHFYWSLMEENDPEYGERTRKFFGAVDAFAGEVFDQAPPGTLFITLSDHGFCSVKREVNVNSYLMDAGLLKMKSDDAKAITDILPESTCYSLLPGRFFLNLKGREAMGSVESGPPAENAKNTVIDLCRNMRDPDSGEQIIKEIYKREDIYHGPYLDEAADILTIPRNGYDLKANFQKKPLTSKDALHGMHTQDDAFLFVAQKEIGAVTPNIVDL
ncbi:MAG: alkaline phosphatase family protein, partial [bacterium]